MNSKVWMVGAMLTAAAFPQTLSKSARPSVYEDDEVRIVIPDGWTRAANRVLLFQNILIDTGDAKVRARCGIPKDLVQWIGEGAEGKAIGERRWFGGYFTTDGGWFFGEGDERCESKLYTLTTAAKRPEQLPAESDAHLAQIVQEAIDIVDSIHYKRCAPTPSSPMR